MFSRSFFLEAIYCKIAQNPWRRELKPNSYYFHVYWRLFHNFPRHSHYTFFGFIFNSASLYLSHLRSWLQCIFIYSFRWGFFFYIPFIVRKRNQFVVLLSLTLFRVFITRKHVYPWLPRRSCVQFINNFIPNLTLQTSIKWS